VQSRLTPGHRIGNYQILDWIGAGDDASAHYRACAVSGSDRGRSALLKCFAVRGMGQEFFFAETRLSKLLRHPNIAQLYDVGRMNGDGFMAFEYVEGISLRRILRGTHHGLPIAAALALGTGIATGLHYAHEKTTATGLSLGIVHGNLSPANAIVTLTGDVKLVDFRHLLAPLPRAAEVAPANARYLSPEQSLGHGLDRRSDVFQLGVLLYEATTGRFPFPGDTEREFLSAILAEPVEPPSRRDPSYPPALERVITTALQREPELRYPTARALGEDLVRVSREIGITISPASLGHACAAASRRSTGEPA
jgi:serine/threonine-protein kinase